MIFIYHSLNIITNYWLVSSGTLYKLLIENSRKGSMKIKIEIRLSFNLYNWWHKLLFILCSSLNVSYSIRINFKAHLFFLIFFLKKLGLTNNYRFLLIFCKFWSLYILSELTQCKFKLFLSNINFCLNKFFNVTSFNNSLISVVKL